MPERRIVRSSCRMCHGVCQVRVHLEDDRVVKVTGDPESPISRGYLCPKGTASPALLYHPDRLTHPLRRVGGRGENRWQRVPWSEAIDEVVIHQVFFDDHVDHGESQGSVGARPKLQLVIGPPGQGRSPRVHHDHLLGLPHRVEKRSPTHAVRRGVGDDVAAPDHDTGGHRATVAVDVADG